MKNNFVGLDEIEDSKDFNENPLVFRNVGISGDHSANVKRKVIGVKEKEVNVPIGTIEVTLVKNIVGRLVEKAVLGVSIWNLLGNRKVKVTYDLRVQTKGTDYAFKIRV